MDGNLASVYLRFWSSLEGKLGRNREPKSTQKCMEKRCKKKKEKRDCQRRRIQNSQPRAKPRILNPGEEVGGWVNPPRRKREEDDTSTKR